MPRSARTYRVKFVYDDGMDLSHQTRTITAFTDAEALREARSIFPDGFELEQYREIRIE